VTPVVLLSFRQRPANASQAESSLPTVRINLDEFSIEQ
jgi:hypothetical protein